jgi:sugar phosphate isomerase/epimerase
MICTIVNLECVTVGRIAPATAICNRLVRTARRRPLSIASRSTNPVSSAGVEDVTMDQHDRPEEAMLPARAAGGVLSRRDFARVLGYGIPASLALARGPLSAFAPIDPRINGVLIGAITYSFRAMNPADIIKAYVDIGLGEMELMSNHAEALAGAPAFARGASARQARGARGASAGQAGGGRAASTPEQQAQREAAAKALRDWRMSATEATFKPVRKRIEDAGIAVKLLCYNMNVRSTQDDEIEYAFMMARALGVDAISTSTQVSMARRLAPFAEKHKMRVGFHGHANTQNPDEVATPQSFEAVMAASPYLGANLDVGHYTEAGYDAVAFLQQHHARVTNLHLKDMKKAANGGGYTPFGQGDAPLKEVLKLVQKNKWDRPVNIEFEYQGDPLVEVPKCLTFVKEALA